MYFFRRKRRSKSTGGRTTSKASTSVQCAECSKEFGSRRRLQKHMRRRHPPHTEEQQQQRGVTTRPVKARKAPDRDFVELPSEDDLHWDLEDSEDEYKVCHFSLKCSKAYVHFLYRKKVRSLTTFLKMPLCQCCGSGMFIPYPGSEFFPFRIPDQHQRI